MKLYRVKDHRNDIYVKAENVWDALRIAVPKLQSIAGEDSSSYSVEELCNADTIPIAVPVPEVPEVPEE